MGVKFDKKRFEQVSKEERKWLENLSVEQSIELMEGLLDSGFVEECKRIQKELGNIKCQKK